MKHWFATHILTTDDLRMEEHLPFSDKEFYISLGMVGLGLTLFGFVVRVIGA